MTTYTANIRFYKDIERYHWEYGCTGRSSLIFSDDIQFEFVTQQDLIKEMCSYITNHFDVNEEDFMSFVSNACENNRFDYDQNEDSNGNKDTLSEQNLEGWLARYQFLILDVYKPVDFEFEIIND